MKINVAKELLFLISITSMIQVSGYEPFSGLPAAPPIVGQFGQ